MLHARIEQEVSGSYLRAWPVAGLTPNEHKKRAPANWRGGSSVLLRRGIAAALEVLPNVLIPHFVVEQNFLSFHDSAQFLRASISRRLLELDVLRMVHFTEKLAAERTSLHVADCIVDIIRKESCSCASRFGIQSLRHRTVEARIEYGVGGRIGVRIRRNRYHSTRADRSLPSQNRTMETRSTADDLI